MSSVHDAKAQSPASALVFSADDDIVGNRRARALVGGLTRAGLTVRHVNKLSCDLDELTLVAKYRIVEVPYVVVLRDDAVIARLSGVPSTRELLDTLAALG